MSSIDPENDEYDRGWFDCIDSCVKPLEKQIEENQRYISYLTAKLRVEEKIEEQLREKDRLPTQEVTTTI
jgi:hypothetical protein